MTTHFTQTNLPAQWYTLVVNEGVDISLPGIYEWRIERVGVYIGKYRRITRPTREYGLNVIRILNNRPYRKSKPTGFRPIHLALARAVTEGIPVVLTILENVLIDINKREDELIRERGTLNGTIKMNAKKQVRRCKPDAPTPVNRFIASPGDLIPLERDECIKPVSFEDADDVIDWDEPPPT